MAEVRIKDIDEHEIDTILAEDIDFEGHLTFKKPLMIKGKFKGEIKSASSLYIGEKAYVEAATEAGIVSSKGRHKGNIVGHTRIELFSTAQVEGDISTPDFVVESGCRFNGNCNMSGTAKKDGPHPQHPQPAATQQAASAQPQQGSQQPQQQRPAASPNGAAQQPAGQQPQQGGQPQQQKPSTPPSGQGGQQK
jgi:cytoskeletal protein CcmA (bactofilin family)